MTGPRPLADVEKYIALVGADTSLTPMRVALEQARVWRDQAYATATRIRAMHRTITMLARTYLPDSPARRAVEHIAADIVGPELLDQDPAVDGGGRG